MLRCFCRNSSGGRGNCLNQRRQGYGRRVVCHVKSGCGGICFNCGRPGFRREQAVNWRGLWDEGSYWNWILQDRGCDGGCRSFLCHCPDQLHFQCWRCSLHLHLHLRSNGNRMSFLDHCRKHRHLHLDLQLLSGDGHGSFLHHNHIHLLLHCWAYHLLLHFRCCGSHMSILCHHRNHIPPLHRWSYCSRLGVQKNFIRHLRNHLCLHCRGWPLHFCSNSRHKILLRPRRKHRLGNQSFLYHCRNRLRLVYSWSYCICCHGGQRSFL
mmetsp:Transcript_188/g.366  ORF Transcript_188/g.366 Transcript_188/m.366 type:complete len:266 (-) Transcript_188:284-1081(-)